MLGMEETRQIERGATGSYKRDNKTFVVIESDVNFIVSGLLNTEILQGHLQLEECFALPDSGIFAYTTYLTRTVREDHNLTPSERISRIANRTHQG